MSILNDYKRKVNIGGSTPKERTINTRVRDYNTTFRRAPEYEQVKLTLSDNTNSTLYDIWLYSNSSYKELVDMKTIIFAPGTSEELVFSGQYVRLQATDNRPEELFMIYSNDKQYENKIKGMVDECTETLRWYDEDGVLRQYPVIILASRGKNLNENKYFILSEGQYIIGVPKNSNTFKLKEGDSFILGQKHKYRIAGFSDIESDTFMSITMEKYEENPSIDDIENGIADFENRPRFTIDINIDASEIVSGNTIQAVTTLIDKDGQTSDRAITYTSSDENICTVNQDGLITTVSNGNCVITASMTNNADVSDTVDILVTDSPTDNIVYKLDNDVRRITRRDSKNYTAQKFNNGEIESETYTFEIISQTISDNQLDYRVVDSDTFSITNLGGGSGNVVVRITPDGDVGNAFDVEFNLVNSYY